jgi:hypothetical protein
MSELKELCYGFTHHFLKEYFSIIFDAAMEENFKDLFNLEWKRFLIRENIHK